MDDSFRRADENLKSDDVKRKVMNKSISIFDLVKDKYFQTLFGAYCLYVQLCEPLNVDKFVEEQIAKFPQETEIIKAFLEFMYEDHDSGFSKSLSTFDPTAAGRSLSPGGSNRKK